MGVVSDFFSLSLALPSDEDFKGGRRLPESHWRREEA